MLYWKDEDLVSLDFTLQKDNYTTQINLDAGEELECIVFKSLNASFLEIYYKEEISQNICYIDSEKIIIRDNDVNVILQENIKTNMFIIKHNYAITDIKLFKRAIKGLIVSARYDAFGARMMSLLNTIYLSKLIGFKFGFIWDHKICQNAKDQYMSLDPASKIFDKKFCDKHEYTYNHLPYTRPDTNDLIGFTTIEEGNQKPYYESYGYRNLYAYYLDLRFEEIYKEEYFDSLKKIYHDLPFSKRYREIIKKTNLIYKDIGNFIGLHFRGADVVNDKDIRIYALTSLSPYIFPLELAMEIIKKENYKTIVLFSSCGIVTKFVKEYFEKNNFNTKIYIANDFLDDTFSYAERDFFNFSLMQHADVLYGSNESMFRALAANISHKDIQNNLVDHIFNLHLQYDIISSSIDNYNIDNLYKSASCIYLFILANRLNLGNKIKLFWLQKGYSYDEYNLSYKILIIEILLLEKRFDEAENELQIIFNSQYKRFFELLFSQFHKDEFLQQRKTFLKYTHLNKPNLSLMIYLISLKERIPCDSIYFLYHMLQEKITKHNPLLDSFECLPSNLEKNTSENSNFIYGYFRIIPSLIHRFFTILKNCKNKFL
ncbi:hypothetical protein [Campylobacter insulaenigrae]|uniref:hypothetical protein n=1 Tax=Campylobacter insulaenigrae TaxID=260714 RepID=UPI00164EBC88|nr:hypothetical protein [Campylobacter insulaenigrae]